ncbi:creatininase family protein [Halococcus sediminicola]|uniref:creatininase family protein n=1 Tax=Halococcus sediminicola TaxID=1264579 RepID=UPI000679D34C|nr:creatininase family protein [Halococcus sediminicola]
MVDTKSHETTSESVLLEELTWPKVEAALDDGSTTAIVPVGSTEQHGPHLPLATDALIGEAIGERLADRLGDALVAPTIRPGCSGHHMDFPGTVSVPSSVLIDVLDAYCESLAIHGFEHVALLPSHGGNFAPVNTAAPEIAHEHDLSVIALADLDRYMELMNEGMVHSGINHVEQVIHAGGTETSAVLAIREDLVREDRLESGFEGEIDASMLLSRGFHELTENGVLGDPRESSAEAGEAILETVAESYAESIREARDALD